MSAAISSSRSRPARISASANSRICGSFAISSAVATSPSAAT